MYDNTIQITSASLVNQMFCTFKFKQEVQKGIFDEITIKSSVPVHQDLKKAFWNLNAHLAVICEQMTAAEIPDIDDLPEYNPMDEDANSPLATKLHKFYVHQFALSGTGENAGVSLNGSMTLETHDTLSLGAPKIKYEESKYPFVNELRIHMDELVAEVEAYRGGKRAPVVVQTEMFEEETEETR